MTRAGGRSDAGADVSRRIPPRSFSQLRCFRLLGGVSARGRTAREPAKREPGICIPDAPVTTSHAGPLFQHCEWPLGASGSMAKPRGVNESETFRRRGNDLMRKPCL